MNDQLAQPHPNWFAPLADAFCIAVEGDDAIRVMNNLCTNDIAKLPVAGVCETFVTNLKGWVVAHGLLAHASDRRVELVGQHPQPTQICDHIDRYIIREDARIQLLESMSLVWTNLQQANVLHGVLPTSKSSDYCSTDPGKSGIDNLGIHAYRSTSNVTWLRCGESGISKLASTLKKALIRNAPEPELSLTQVRLGWPRMGHEIGDKSIPQELDRDERAISFTKGCYLGQETIARLDARGTLQKKLCILQLRGKDPVELSMPVMNQEVEVGRLTSLAEFEERRFAFAYVKRGSFDVGQQLSVGSVPAVVCPPMEFPQDGS